MAARLPLELTSGTLATGKILAMELVRANAGAAVRTVVVSAAIKALNIMFHLPHVEYAYWMRTFDQIKGGDLRLFFLRYTRNRLPAEERANQQPEVYSPSKYKFVYLCCHGTTSLHPRRR
jgi:hypothetical protein